MIIFVALNSKYTPKLKFQSQISVSHFLLIIAGSDTEICCNLMEEEDTFHFIAKCPILSPFRRLYWKKERLDEQEFFKFFKKENLRKLTFYRKYAWDYRYRLVQEFNY